MCLPELFRINCDKEASEADLIKFSNGILQWDLTFTCSTGFRIGKSNSMDVIYGVSLPGVGMIRCVENHLRRGALRLEAINGS